MNKVLELKNIHKSFPGVLALQGVDFTLREGEIHALMGENGAGKSTLIKVITGVYTKDEGTISLSGKEVTIKSPQDAQKVGISTVYQEITLCPNLSVAENMYIGRTEGAIQNWGKMNEEADKILQSLDIPAKATQQLGNCSIAVQQMVAIARAVDMDCKVLILDEPTSSLDEQEVAKLFKLMRDLKARGVGIIFVTHFMDQVYEVSDRITVLRDGKLVGEYTVAELPRVQLVSKMLGKDLDDMADIKSEAPDSQVTESSKVIEATNLSSDQGIKPFDFYINKGETLGLVGETGCGKTTVGRTILHLYEPTDGEVYFKGKKIETKADVNEFHKKATMVFQDPYSSLNPRMTVADIIGEPLDVHKMYSSEEERTQKVYDLLNLVGLSKEHASRYPHQFSGGQRQRVALGRAIVRNPKVFLFDEPLSNLDAKLRVTMRSELAALHNRLQEEAFLNAGLRISITDSRVSSEELPESERKDVMCYEGGIREYVTYINDNKTPIHDDVIYMSGTKDDAMAELAMQYTDTYTDNIVSFANNVHTPEGGMHEDGFKLALTRVLNKYGKEKGILKADDKVSGEDCREGITCVISVKLTEAQFEGQTKSKLGNLEIKTLVNSLVGAALEQYLDDNPAVGKLILEKALTANRAREAARKARETVRRKNGLESGQMPDKLQDCNERDPSLCEIYIVEGDSAAGSAIQGRDSRFQAILPMWGKMLNVEKARVDKVYDNDKLHPLIVAFGCGIGEEFSLEKLRYHKIIIMSDADVDGAHIRTLLLTFFFRYMRPLIENGYVYSAVPPLYKLTKGKTQRVAYSDEERDKVSAELRGDKADAKIDISRFKGLGEMDSHELWETTMDPEKRTLRRITLDDAIAADRIFNLLMGEEVDPRREWIEVNAKYVENLDI